jgi:hypothetical protein
MIRHVVLFRWNDATTPEDVDRIQAALGELPGVIPEIRSYTLGPDIGVGQGTWDFALVAEFDDAAAWKVYDEHPQHEQVRAGLVVPHLADRATVRFEL